MRLKQSIYFIALAMSMLSPMHPAQALPNPASVNCTNQGGKYSIVDTFAGQVGYCLLPNGTRCEEWALFLHECPVPVIKPGSYQVISIKDKNVQSAARFAAQTLSHGKASLKRTLKAEEQVVSGKNYRVAIELSNGKRYQVVVFKPLENKPLKLTSSQLLR